MGPATTLDPTIAAASIQVRMYSWVEAMVVGVGQIATGTHGGTDRCAEVVAGQDLGDAGGVPVTRILDAQLQQIEAHRLDPRRNLRDGRVRRWGNPDPGIDPDRIHAVALSSVMTGGQWRTLRKLWNAVNRP